MEGLRYNWRSSIFLCIALLFLVVYLSSNSEDSSCRVLPCLVNRSEEEVFRCKDWGEKHHEPCRRLRFSGSYRAMLANNFMIGDTVDLRSAIGAEITCRSCVNCCSPANIGAEITCRSYVNCCSPENGAEGSRICRGNTGRGDDTQRGGGSSLERNRTGGGGGSHLERSHTGVDCHLVALLSLLSSLFLGAASAPEERESAGFPEEKASLCTVIVTLVALILVCAVLGYRSFSRIMSLRCNKAFTMVVEEGPPVVRERDQDGWPLSHTLPLKELVNLKKRPPLQDLSFATKRRKQGAPPAVDWLAVEHFFQFRRDQRLGPEVVTACPTTTTFASFFVSGSYKEPGATQELNKEGVRLATFRDFPPTVPVSALRLAQVGFYYLGERDQVQCFLCGLTHQGWQLGDKPAVIHARNAPHCPLVRGADTTNIPLPLPITSLPPFPSMDSGYGSVPQEDSSSASLGEPVGGSASASASASAGGSVQATTVSDSDGAGGTPLLAISGSAYVPDSARTQPPSSLGGLGGGSTSLAASETPQMSGAQATPALTTSGSAHASQALASSSAAAPVASSLATLESGSSVFSGSPLPGGPADSVAVAAAGGGGSSLPLPRRRLDLMGAVYPLYSQLDARRRSFSPWVAHPGLPSVDTLVTLGFFYAGYADCVRCFFCGIGLKSWEAEDVPAEVHARWRPTCEYLRLVKGDVFVDTVANGGDVSSLEARNANAGSMMIGQSAQPAPASNTQSEQTPPPPPLPAPVPDLPVVRRARETGYTDQQIAEGIQKLRVIGMVDSMDAMLIEILTNLFDSGTAQTDGTARPNGTNNNSSSTDNNSNNDDNGRVPVDRLPGSRDNDMQHDGPRAADPPPVVQDERALQDHHQALQQENARLRDMRQCQHCRQRPVGVIYLPCGHIVACTVCAPSMRHCLRCDGVIRATANVFFS